MARIFDEFNILMDGVRLATKEEEQLDLINHISSFCVKYRSYFCESEMEKIENSLVETIDFANQLDYTYDAFMPFYKKTITCFSKFFAHYMGKIESKPMISFIVTARLGGEEFAKTIQSLLKYRNTEYEIVILDCSTEKRLKNQIKTYGDSNRVLCFTGAERMKLQDEINANIKCNGQFVFPVTEGDEIIEKNITDMIIMLKNNPQAGTIFSPDLPENSIIDPARLWEIAARNSEKVLSLRDLRYKTGFGYKRECIDFEKDEVLSEILSRCDTDVDLYRLISRQLSDFYDVLLFGRPIYKRI